MSDRDRDLFDSWTLGPMPTGNKLDDGKQRRGAVGTIDSLLPATPEAVAIAKRCWVELEEKEIERRGKTWLARGESYRLAEFNPFLGSDPAESSVSAFAVIDGRLLLLRRRGELGKVTTTPVGSVRGSIVPGQSR